MVDIHDLKIGAPGPFLPPWENALKNAKTIDSLGYDSMAFPDHSLSVSSAVAAYIL
jgi:hypothetical protein